MKKLKSMEIEEAKNSKKRQKMLNFGQLPRGKLAMNPKKDGHVQ
jgi:hypothetical protein